MTYLKILYLWLLKQLPHSKERYAICYLMSFSFNDGQLIQQLARRYPQDFIVFFTKSTHSYAEELADQGILVRPFSPKELLLKNGISTLKNAKVIVADNYFPEIAALDGHQSIIQLWHAVGAVKNFGWTDPANHQRSQWDQQRFQQVYDRFTDIVVGSEAMGEVFIQSYQVSPQVIRPLGIPKTDVLVHQTVQGKKVLYAPTYRQDSEQMKTVIQEALWAFTQCATQVFTLKLHPTVHLGELQLPTNVTVTTAPLTQLLPETDVLITDYSASVFEFMVGRQAAKVIFFVPDLAHYRQSPGIQETFLSTAPGPVVSTTQELVQVLKQSSFTSYQEAREQFNQRWNQYNDGQALDRVLALIQARLGREK